MTAEQVDMYQHIPSMDQTIPVGVNSFPIADSVPKEKYITWEVCSLCMNH